MKSFSRMFPLFADPQWLDSFRDSLWGTALLPLLLLVFGVLGFWTLARFARYFILRRLRAARRHDQPSLVDRFFLKRGTDLLTSFRFVFGVAVLVLALNCLSLWIEGFSEAMEGHGKTMARAIVSAQHTARGMLKLAEILYDLCAILFIAVWSSRFFSDLLSFLLIKSSQDDNPYARQRLRSETLKVSGSYFISSLVFVVAALSALQSVGLNIAPLLATAGVASVAIGFGAQSLVKDYLNGFFILLEDQFAVGDVVEVSGRSGLVEAFTMRVTKLRSSDGSLTIVPNGEIKSVRNMTSEWSRVDFRIGIAYGNNIDFALKILGEEALNLYSDMGADLLEPPQVLGIDRIQDSQIILRAWFKTRPSRSWDVERAFNLTLLKRFEKEGIEMPTPPRVQLASVGPMK